LKYFGYIFIPSKVAACSTGIER